MSTLISLERACAGHELPNKKRVPRVKAISRLGGVMDHLIPYPGLPGSLGDPRAFFLGVVDVELVERGAALEERVPRIENFLEVLIERRIVKQREASLSGHRNG